MTAFGSTGLGAFGRVTVHGLTQSQIATLYVVVGIVLALALVMWFMICVDIPGWFAAAMFSFTVAVIAETMFRKGDVTQNNVDIALSVFIFVLLLAALWEGQRLLVWAAGALVVFLAAHWSKNLALQILIPILVAVTILLILHWLTKDPWQMVYQVLCSFSSSWALVYCTLFLFNGGSIEHIDYSAHDLLEGPMCFAEQDCAFRISALLLLVAVRMLCILINKSVYYFDCAFCWNERDVEDAAQREKLLQQSALVALLVQQHMTTAKTSPSTDGPKGASKT